MLPGIAIAVALSILNVFRRAWWPYATVLGRVEGVEGYHDTRSYPGAEHLPGLVIYRFDGPLFFANATTFRDEVRRLASSEPKPTWIVIAAEPVTDVDTTASDVLEDLDEALNAQGISLVLAELKDPVRDKIERYGLTRTIDPRHFFPTVGAAVVAFRQVTGAEWTAAGQATDDGTGPSRTGAETGPPGDVPALPPAGYSKTAIIRHGRPWRSATCTGSSGCPCRRCSKDIPGAPAGRAGGSGLTAGQTGISLRSVSIGAERGEASARSAGQSIPGLGGRTPGRSRGTRTRSARGRITHCTGVGIMTVSPSIPTGISGTSASTTTSPAARTITPPPLSSLTAPIALFTVTTTTPSVPASSRARWPSPAMSLIS